MKMLKPVAAAITLALATTSVMAMGNNVKIHNKTEKGRPAFVSGKLGNLAPGQEVAALKKIVNENANYHAHGNENFKVKHQWKDNLGKGHSRITQTINGLNVYGTNMMMHTDKETGQDLVNIYAVTGKLAVNPDPESKVNVHKGNGKSRKLAKEVAAQIGDIQGKPELSYIYLPLTDETKLAWRVRVTWNNGGDDFGDDFLFIDAEDQSVLTRHAQVHQAKNWQTDDMNHISESTVGPSTPRGTLLCTNNEACNEDSAQRAHDAASEVYDYYQEQFNRLSINGSDMTVVSGVHVGVNYNNAFWYNNRMWYGDGDGSQFIDLTNGFDVVGHELTHGVTEYTAGLVYENASGALNEAWSDILGMSADAYKKGSTQPDWLLGEEVMASGSGALRYMNNPTQDGYSTDWYPDRISFTSNPTNSNDHGGVHGNSGIANLAYQLVVDGGTHPRGKSSAVVPSIGLAKAEQIFYRALTTYMSSSTDFAGARSATAQAATDLYGATEATAVETAWCAVGVGSCPGTTTPTTDVLENGVEMTGLEASTGQELDFTMEVPAGASDLSFNISGGSGDADLYVKFGSAPTTSSYDCRPWKNGNTESCSFSTPQAGTYHVMVRAYSTFDGVGLTGSFTESTGGVTGGSESKTNLSLSRGQWDYTALDIPAGMSTLTVTMSGGSGDADLYIRQGSNPTTSTYACRSWASGNTESCTINNPAAGNWNVGIYGYAASSGMNVTMEWQP
ncbi:hemagglutinin [Thalassotalea insulae]|uniref:Hemagglutinin n=1 Tax=Thalassotalea insulae TaxID=2056778 RepID=A0ABQ6GXW2_9GAMM|nr:M4 family metallopeptidase [Thalassotalea insulae]GLX79442.1 hemagglutinin [Thalassotalea insulae]